MHQVAVREGRFLLHPVTFAMCEWRFHLLQASFGPRSAEDVPKDGTSSAKTAVFAGNLPVFGTSSAPKGNGRARPGGTDEDRERWVWAGQDGVKLAGLVRDGLDGCGPGRTWHHRRTSRPAVTGDLRPRAMGLSDGVPVAGKSGSCPGEERLGVGKRGGCPAREIEALLWGKLPTVVEGGCGFGSKTGAVCSREAE